MKENHKVICTNCGKEHDGTYGSGRFCSKECAKSFSTKQDNPKELKEAKCSKCGTSLFINKRASSKTCLCESCKTKIYKTCSLCGRIYEKGKKCENEFCHNHTLQQLKSLITFGFDISKLKTLEVEFEFNRIKKILEFEYFENRITEDELKTQYQYTSGISNFHKILKSIGIKTLSKKEAVHLSYFIGRSGNCKNHNKYHSSWHTTWNNKKVYLRSSYELDYAKELDEQKIDYEVESLRIKYFDTQRNEYRCAIPDFYLPETNTIIEIKSEWTLDIQNMKDKFKTYKELGYDCKLICEHKNILI